MSTDTLEFPSITAPAEPRTEVAIAASASIDIATINLTDLALAKFGNWRAEAQKVKDEFTALVLDLKTQSAIDDAISLRNRKIKQPLADARKTAAHLKSCFAAASKAVGDRLPVVEAAWADAAGAITPRIEAAQTVIDEAKAEAARIEVARVAQLQERMATIGAYLIACQAPGMTAARIANGIAMLERATFGPDWQEFAVPAANLQCQTLEGMRTLHAQAVSREAEAARQEAIRLENERVAKQLAEERARIEAEAAEIRRQAAELQRQKDEAEQAELLRKARELNESQAASLPRTGTPEGHLLQDLDRGLSDALSSDPNARQHALDAAAAITNTQGQHPQQVLKAEPETADATDRGTAADASPRVGAMGVGQPADAGPAVDSGLAALQADGLDLSASDGDAPLAPTSSLHGLVAELVALAAEARRGKFPSQPKVGTDWWARFYAVVDALAEGAL